MDIRRLEIFLKVLETRSLSKTATALGLTQPTVSTNLKMLEESLGHKLFARTSRTVTPLPQAIILEPYAKTIIEAVGEAAWALGGHDGGIKETLTIGVSSVPSIVILPRAATEYTSAYPHVALKVKTGESSAIIRRVIDGEVEIGIVGLRQENPSLVGTVVARDRMALLASRALIAAVGSLPKTPDDLIKWPLIMREEGSGTRTAFLDMLSKRPGLASRLRIVAETEGIVAAIALARTGIGATPVSSLLCDGGYLTNDLTVVPLDFLPHSRSFHCIRSRHFPLSPAARELIKMVKKSVKK